jgi:hypothetical protein
MIFNNNNFLSFKKNDKNNLKEDHFESWIDILNSEIKDIVRCTKIFYTSGHIYI